MRKACLTSGQIERQALEYAATHLSGGAAGKLPARLAPAAEAWVAAKRAKVTAAMWHSAGIVRNRADLKVRAAAPGPPLVDVDSITTSSGGPLLVQVQEL